MSDARVYRTSETYTCGICGCALIWEKRPDSSSLILAHYAGGASCANDRKKFYAPGHDLTEFKEDLGG